MNRRDVFFIIVTEIRTLSSMEQIMKKDGYYSSGEFASMAQVTLRTIRYYDKQNILKPSFVTEAGARFYSDKDLAKLQQILLLKYLGFSLDDIRELTIGELDHQLLLDSLEVQLKLVRDRIEQLQLVENAILDTSGAIRDQHHIDWSQMLQLIHLTGMEKSLKNQYQNASNISSRIRLHHLYSANPQGWFPWLFSLCGIRPGMHVLEVGCGDGAFWSENRSLIPEDIAITLSDRSEGMLRDARRNAGPEDPRFSFQVFDASWIPFPDDSFDLVIANHVLFYCEDIPAVSREIARALKKDGLFVCSTYGSAHMQEITRFVQQFDERISLSAEHLYDRFGRENGASVLSESFPEITWQSYEDHLMVTEPEPLIAYILSCHGNQNQYILDRYKDFRAMAVRQTKKGFYITKDAGAFLCRTDKNQEIPK